MQKILWLYVIFILCTNTVVGLCSNITNKPIYIYTQNKSLELPEIRETGKYKVVIKYKAFDKNNHRLKFHSQDQVVMKIDDKKYHGTDGSIPTTEISSFSLFEAGTEYKFPLFQYKSLFNPHLEKGVVSDDVFSIKETNNKIEIKLSGGDGAGGYHVKWLIFKKSKKVVRQLFEFPDVEKPQVTVSRLEKT